MSINELEVFNRFQWQFKFTLAQHGHSSIFDKCKIFQALFIYNFFSLENYLFLLILTEQIVSHKSHKSLNFQDDVYYFAI